MGLRLKDGLEFTLLVPLALEGRGLVSHKTLHGLEPLVAGFAHLSQQVLQCMFLLVHLAQHYIALRASIHQ